MIDTTGTTNNGDSVKYHLIPDPSAKVTWDPADGSRMIDGVEVNGILANGHDAGRSSDPTCGA